MTEERFRATILINSGYTRKFIPILVAGVTLATIQFPSAAKSQPTFEPKVQDYARQETLTDGYSRLSDESLPFWGDESRANDIPYGRGEYGPDFGPTDQRQRPQEQQPLRVEPQAVVIDVAHRKSRAPTLKGHASFLLGLLILLICEAAIRSDPAAKGMSLTEGVGLNMKSLFQLRDIVRSLLVVVSAFTAPFFFVVGSIQLAKTFPSWIKWAKDNDEVGVAHFMFLVFYIWLQFVDPAGKLR